MYLKFYCFAQGHYFSCASNEASEERKKLNVIAFYSVLEELQRRLSTTLLEDKTQRVALTFNPTLYKKIFGGSNLEPSYAAKFSYWRKFKFCAEKNGGQRLLFSEADETKLVESIGSIKEASAEYSQLFKKQNANIPGDINYMFDAIIEFDLNSTKIQKVDEVKCDINYHEFLSNLSKKVKKPATPERRKEKFEAFLKLFELLQETMGQINRKEVLGISVLLPGGVYYQRLFSGWVVDFVKSAISAIEKEPDKKIEETEEERDRQIEEAEKERDRQIKEAGENQNRKLEAEAKLIEKQKEAQKERESKIEAIKAQGEQEKKREEEEEERVRERMITIRFEINSYALELLANEETESIPIELRHKSLLYCNTLCDFKPYENRKERVEKIVKETEKIVKETEREKQKEERDWRIILGLGSACSCFILWHAYKLYVYFSAKDPEGLKSTEESIFVS